MLISHKCPKCGSEEVSAINGCFIWNPEKQAFDADWIGQWSCSDCENGDIIDDGDIVRSILETERVS